jgi:hypothetical protein
MAKKKTAAKAKAVAKRGTTDIVVSDYAEYDGQGFEDQTQADLAIPFLSILQALSPQLEDVDQGGMEGAKAGMIFNTVTEQLYDGKEGLLFLPAKTQHTFVEWVPRDAGGGFVAVHDPASELVKQAKAEADEFGKYKIGENDLVETFYVYGVTCGPEPDDPTELAVLAFTSTKIKAYKRWNTKLSMFMLKTENGRKIKPPMFAHLTRLTSVADKNNKGKFFNVSLTPANGTVKDSLLPPSDPRFESAAACKEMVDSGAARAAYETQQAAGTGTTDESNGAASGEKPPF